MTLRTRASRAVAAAAAVATAVIFLGTAAPANAATTVPVAAPDIIARAVDEAKKQGAGQDFAPPIVQPRWKILFLGVTDVIYTNGSPRQTMDANERLYAKTVVDQFVDALETRIGVQVSPTFSWVDDTFTSTAGDRALHEWQLPDMINEHAA